MGRRLDSFNRSVGMEERIVAIDKFSQKMVNSGHTVKTVRSFLVSGIKGYKRSRPGNNSSPTGHLFFRSKSYCEMH